MRSLADSLLACLLHTETADSQHTSTDYVTAAQRLQARDAVASAALYFATMTQDRDLAARALQMFISTVQRPTKNELLSVVCAAGGHQA